MTTHENSRSCPGSAEYRLNGHVLDPKMIFAKKLGGLLFSAKVQNHLGSSKNG
jgi:hypothetical protein